MTEYPDIWMNGHGIHIYAAAKCALILPQIQIQYKYKYLLCDTKDPVELNKLEQLKGFVVVEV